MSADPKSLSKRNATLAGLAALVSVACWLGALVLANAGAAGSGSGVNSTSLSGQPATLNRVLELTTFHAGAGDELAAMLLRCVGLALTGVVALALFAAVRACRPEASRARLLGTGWLAVALVIGSTVVGYVALAHLATVFHTGPHTQARAKHLIDGSAALHVSAVFDLISRIVLALWLVLLCLEMLRAELLDTFLAYWGFGAGAAMILLPVGDAMFIGWLASIGFVLLGRWPGGRPEGWLLTLGSSA